MTTCPITQEQPTDVIVAANDQAVPGTLNSIEVTKADRIPNSPAALQSAIVSAVEPAFDSISDATQVSYAKYANVNRVTPKPLSWIINQIRTSQDLKEKVSQIRAEADPAKRSDLKAALLPYFMFMAFEDNKRDVAHFKSTKFMIQDIDHVGDRMETLRAELKADNRIFMFFTSPSGDGLKVVLALNKYIIDADVYKKVYEKFMVKLKEWHNVVSDSSTTDAARACFLSYDPELHVNWTPIRHEIPVVEKEAPVYSLTAELGDLEDGSAEFLKLFKGVVAGGTGQPGRHAATIKLASLYKSKLFSYDFTLGLLESWNTKNTPPLDSEEFTKTIKQVYDTESYGNKTGDKVEYVDAADLIKQLNKTYALVTMGGDTVVIDTRNPKEPQFLKTKTFRDRIAAHGMFEKKKNAGMEWIPAYGVWMESARRREYDRIVFRPNGKPNPREFNLWFQGRAVEPQEAQFPNIERHIREVICSNDETTYHYLMLWIAHLVQKPEQKVGVAPLLISPGKGTGKGVFVDNILKPLVGHEFYASISRADAIIGRFNRTLERCMLCFLDEAFFAGDVRAQKTLDTYITADRINIERKGIDSIQVDSFTRFILATNDYHAIHSSVDERRYLVLRVSEVHKQDPGYFEPLVQKYIPAELPGFLHHLLHLDISKFDRFNPPKTEALMEQAEYSLDSFDAWYSDWLANESMSAENDAGMIVQIINFPGGFYTASAGSVYKAYTRFCHETGYRFPLKPVGLGRRLADKGVTSVRTMKDGVKSRTYDFQKEYTRWNASQAV